MPDLTLPDEEPYTGFTHLQEAAEKTDRLHELLALFSAAISHHPGITHEKLRDIMHEADDKDFDAVGDVFMKTGGISKVMRNGETFYYPIKAMRAAARPTEGTGMLKTFPTIDVVAAYSGTVFYGHQTAGVQAICDHLGEADIAHTLAAQHPWLADLDIPDKSTIAAPTELEARVAWIRTLNHFFAVVFDEHGSALQVDSSPA
jgi:hypothetical protein